MEPEITVDKLGMICQIIALMNPRLDVSVSEVAKYTICIKPKKDNLINFMQMKLLGYIKIPLNLPKNWEYDASTKILYGGGDEYSFTYRLIKE